MRLVDPLLAIVCDRLSCSLHLQLLGHTTNPDPDNCDTSTLRLCFRWIMTYFDPLWVPWLSKAFVDLQLGERESASRLQIEHPKGEVQGPRISGTKNPSAEVMGGLDGDTATGSPPSRCACLGYPYHDHRISTTICKVGCFAIFRVHGRTEFLLYDGGMCC